MPAAQRRVSRFRFKISENYDDHELSDLFETLELRGASYEHLGPEEPGWYILEVESPIKWIPFYKTIKECPSIARVRGMGIDKVVYQCEPEG